MIKPIFKGLLATKELPNKLKYLDKNDKKKMVRNAHREHAVLRPQAHPKKRGAGGEKNNLEYEFKMFDRFDGGSRLGERISRGSFSS